MHPHESTICFKIKGFSSTSFHHLLNSSPFRVLKLYPSQYKYKFCSAFLFFIPVKAYAYYSALFTKQGVLVFFT